MNRWTLLGLLALTTCLAARADDPPLNPAKLTDRQLLEDLQDKMRDTRTRLDTLSEQIKMLENRLKDLGGLGDKFSQTDEQVKKRVTDLELMLNRVLLDQKAVLDLLQKQQQAVEDLRRAVAAPPLPPAGGATGSEAYKPMKPLEGGDVDQRLRRIEEYLAQMGAIVAEMRKVTPVPLPPPPTRPLPQETLKTLRRVRVVNKAPFAVTVNFNDLPFKVEANATGDYIADQDTFTYEVVGSDRPRKTVTVGEGQTMTLTLNWP
jgi:uncharacterized protein YhaN